MQLFILYLPSWGTWNDLKCIFHKHFLTDAAGVKFFWIMSLCSSLSLLKNHVVEVVVCSIFIVALTLSISKRSEYWEQKVLSVFTCSSHQRKLCQLLLGVTHEDTNIDHLDQWNENNRSCDPISIDQLETSAYLISCALREHFPGCWDMGQRYESSANSSRSQKTSRRFRFIHSL